MPFSTTTSFHRVPRLFLDAAVGLGEFPQQRAYLDTSPPVNKPPAGSNDSSADDFFRSDGFSNWIELDFKYVLDIGHGRYTPINTYTLSNGLLVGGASGGDVFNPFKSGRSYVQAKLFHQDRDFDEADPSTVLKTSGIGFSFKYDNTDFQVNPSTGNVFEIEIKHDPGSYDRESWTVGELEFSQYFKLTPGAKVEQSVIAFDFWTAHTFSDDDPPFYMRPKLGGLYRLRAYPIERFHDNSAIYYSAEYRIIPESDILRSLSFLDFADLQWWSLAAFVEYGRVAPQWDLKELHKSMKNDFGLSMRVMAAQDIARLDLVWSTDDTAVWLMYGQPFQFRARYNQDSESWRNWLGDLSYQRLKAREKLAGSVKPSRNATSLNEYCGSRTYCKPSSRRVDSINWVKLMPCSLSLRCRLR